MLAAVLSKDIDGLKAVLHPDLEVIEPISLPYGGTYRGLDAFLGDLFVQMTSGFDIGMEDVRVIDGGNAVASQMTVVFTSKRTGVPIKMPYVEVYDLEDGMIRRVEVYPSDTKLMAEFMAANA